MTTAFPFFFLRWRTYLSTRTASEWPAARNWLRHDVASDSMACSTFSVTSCSWTTTTTSSAAAAAAVKVTANVDNSKRKSVTTSFNNHDEELTKKICNRVEELLEYTRKTRKRPCLLWRLLRRLSSRLLGLPCWWNYGHQPVSPIYKNPFF